MNQVTTMLLRYVILFLLVAASASEPVTLVDGWGPGERVKIGAVYWMAYQMPGESVSQDRPFVVIRSLGNGYYRLIRMSDSMFSNLKYVITFTKHTPDVRPAKDFFGDNAKLQISAESAIYLNNYFVFPRERYDIIVHPKYLKRWPSYISTIPYKGLESLVAASDGMVRGWTPGIVYPSPGPVYPRSGFIYWVLPRDYGYPHPTFGIYSPVVFIDLDGDSLCIVARLVQKDTSMMQHTRNKVPASRFFGKDKMLPTPYQKEPVNLNNFFLILAPLFSVKRDPNVMQLYDWDHTRVTSDMAKLVAYANKLKRGRDSMQQQTRVA